MDILNDIHIKMPLGDLEANAKLCEILEGCAH